MRKKERCINLAKALFVLLNLLKPCFLVFGKSCSLHKHHQAIRLFPCQNKHRKKERAEAEVKKKERKEREGAANKIWFNILDKKNIFFSKKSTFLVSKREFIGAEILWGCLSGGNHQLSLDEFFYCYKPQHIVSS